MILYYTLSKKTFPKYLCTLILLRAKSWFLKSLILVLSIHEHKTPSFYYLISVLSNKI